MKRDHLIGSLSKVAVYKEAKAGSRPIRVPRLKTRRIRVPDPKKTLPPKAPSTKIKDPGVRKATIKSAGGLRDALTLGVPTAIWAGFGHAAGAPPSFDGKVKAKLKANPSLEEEEAVKEVHQEEQADVSGAKSNDMKQFATTSGGALIGLLLGLQGRRLIR